MAACDCRRMSARAGLVALVLLLAMALAPPAGAGPFLAVQGNTAVSAGASIGWGLSQGGVGLTMATTDRPLSGYVFAFPVAPPDSARTVSPYVRLELRAADRAPAIYLGTYLLRHGDAALATEAGAGEGADVARVWAVYELGGVR